MRVQLRRSTRPGPRSRNELRDAGLVRLLSSLEEPLARSFTAGCTLGQPLGSPCLTSGLAPDLVWRTSMVNLACPDPLLLFPKEFLVVSITFCPLMLSIRRPRRHLITLSSTLTSPWRCPDTVWYTCPLTSATCCTAFPEVVELVGATDVAMLASRGVEGTTVVVSAIPTISGRHAATFSSRCCRSTPPPIRVRSQRLQCSSPQQRCLITGELVNWVLLLSLPLGSQGCTWTISSWAPRVGCCLAGTVPAYVSTMTHL